MDRPVTPITDAARDEDTARETLTSGPSSFGRYCRTWFIGTLAIGAMLGAFNVIIDPYLVIGAPRIPGLNAVKPETQTHTELSKGYLIQRFHPVGVMFGDSKVDIGLDPSSPYWPDDARPVFDDGVPGSNVADTVVYLRRAIAAGPVRRALVLIEITDFMKPAPDGTVPLRAEPSRFAAIQQRLSDTLLATLSLDTLTASIRTIAAQYTTNPVDLSPAGATSDGGFRTAIASDGYDTVFLQKDIDNLASIARLKAALAARPLAGFANLDSVSEIIALCHEHGIKLDLAIAPFHADNLEAIDRAGLWPRYQQAKVALTDRVAAAAGNDVRLWDFTGYDQYSTEPVPGPSQRRWKTHWFWEPNHFKHGLGDLMLSVIYRGGTGYGVRLTPANIGQRFAEQSAAKAAFEADDRGVRDRLQRAASR
jgi:hypothetical protein